MLLQGKNAVVHGGGGAIGAAVARGFAREGARVFLAGRTLAEPDQVARTISATGGTVEAAEVDALDEQAVDAHAEAVATSHTGQVFSVLAERAGTTVGSMLAERARTARLLKRLPRGGSQRRGLRRLGSRQRHDRRHRQPHLRLAGRLLMQLPGGATR